MLEANSSPPILYPPPMPPHYHEVDEDDGSITKSSGPEHMAHSEVHVHRAGYVYTAEGRKLRWLNDSKWTPDHKHEIIISKGP